MRLSRRELLTLGVPGGAGLATLTASAVADHTREAPAFVTTEFDADWLETYQPKIETQQLDIQPLGLHCLKATSPEYQYDWGVYWALYPNQEGVTDADSHFRDHEPVYVAVDDSGDVAKCLYSGYHWLKAEAIQPPTDGTHVTLRAINPWHHYVLSDGGRLDIELRDLTESFQSWLGNHELDEDLRVGAVLDPAIMDDAPHWWREQFGISTTAILLNVRLELGIGRDTEKTDL